jgi:hemoglobin-like flavoprotein
MPLACNASQQSLGELVTASLERAAARCEDLTPLVYERLFRAHPETRTMFRTEGSALVKGSMLELALEAILDFAGARKAAHRMIYCEVQSHEAYGTPHDLFGVFFNVIADCVRDLLGNEWTPETEAAWRQLLAELDRYVKDAIQALEITS